MNRRTTIHSLTPALLAATLLSVAAPGCTSRSGVTGDASEDATSNGESGDDEADPSEGGTSAGSTSAGDTTEGDGDDTGDGGQPHDGPGLHEPCDFWAQDCAPGQKCTIAATTPGNGTWDAYICVDAGTEPPGAPCSIVEGADPYGATDTCDAPGFCYNLDAQTGLGTCIELCSGTPENPGCPETGWDCQTSATGLIYFCMPGCAPVAGLECPDCVECDEGSGCVADYQGATLDGFVCYPLAAEGAAGESCECVNCCANGLMCTDAATYGPDCADDLCCTELCNITDLAFTCAGPDQQCVALFEPTDPVWANLGACMVP